MSGQGLRVGAVNLTINPELGMAKGGLRLFGSPIESIDDDLYLGALVLESGGVTLCLIACDLGNSRTEEALEIRTRVANALEIPVVNVMFNLSHNHSAADLPTMLHGNADAQDISRSEKYFESVVEQAVLAATTAQAQQRPARMAHAWGVSDLNIYRREWNGDQDVLGEVPDHEIDDSVGVIRFDDLEGNPIAIVFRYSCHPVVNGAQSPTLSADFPGPARKIIEKNVGGTALFLQGCGGNINPQVGIGYEKDCSEEVYRMGTALGAEVVRVALGLRTNKFQEDRVLLQNVPNILFKPWRERTDHPEIPLGASHEIAKFSFVPLPSTAEALALQEHWEQEIVEREKRGALTWEIRVAKKMKLWADSVVAGASQDNPTRDFEAHAFRIGDVAIVGLNVEAFFETGEEIRAQSPWPDTFVIGYTNGTIMYLPRAQDHPRQGWKWPNTHALPDLLPQSYCQPALWHPDSEQKAVRAALNALNSLR
jgi:hypothetical protein